MRQTAKITSFGPDRIEAGLPMLVAGLSDRYAFERRGEIPEQWARFAPYIGSVRSQLDAAALGAVSFLPGGFDYMTGVHVWDADELPAGFTVLRIPERRYAVFAHRGHVSTLAETCAAALHGWLPRSGLLLGAAPQITEVYGEGFNLSAGRGDIEVWIALA